MRTLVGQVDTYRDGHRVRQQAGSYRDNVRAATSALAQVSIESTRWPGEAVNGPGPHQVTVLTVHRRYWVRPAAIDHVGRATPTASRAWTHCRSALARERWWVRQTRVATAIAFASKPAPTGIISARRRRYWARRAASDHVGRATPTASRASTICRSALAREHRWFRRHRPCSPARSVGAGLLANRPGSLPVNR
jgi:hypothetical protein